MIEKATSIAELFVQSEAHLGKTARVQGWVRTRRDSKAGISFIELNDGSCLKSVQIIADHNRPEYHEILADITTGSSLQVEGTVMPSPGKGQPIEIQADRITLFGRSDPLTYPLQKKRHSLEFLTADCSSAASFQHHWCGDPGAQSIELQGSPVFPGARVLLHPYPNHHLQ